MGEADHTRWMQSGRRESDGEARADREAGVRAGGGRGGGAGVCVHYHIHKEYGCTEGVIGSPRIMPAFWVERFHLDQRFHMKMRRESHK